MVIGAIHAQPKSVAQLQSQVKPATGTELEAYQHVLYSVRTYTSGTTRDLTFFDFVGAADATNMEAAAQLPDPQFFEIWGHHFGVRRRLTNTAEGITGALDDVEQLVRSGGGTYELVIGAKVYGPELLENAHALGGPTGFGWGLDNVAAGGTPSQTVYANNGILGYGLNYRGSVTIPPKQRFLVRVRWPAALTLTGNVDVYFAFSGVHHREVK